MLFAQIPHNEPRSLVRPGDYADTISFGAKPRRFSARLKPIFYLGPVGIPGNYLAAIVFSLGIGAVVLSRFIRVARDEERAAAELEAVRTVQQVLVPEDIPTIPGFAIEAVYHPAGQVGGDFFQIIPAPSGGVLVVIGDVSGKGMPAAMTVSLLVGSVRTLVDYTQSPAEILTAMNQRIVGAATAVSLQKWSCESMMTERSRLPMRDILRPTTMAGNCPSKMGFPSALHPILRTKSPGCVWRQGTH